MLASIAGVLVCSSHQLLHFSRPIGISNCRTGPLKLPTGLTDDGHPWIGSDSAPIVITEYSDYLCFQCKKMNYYLRQLISQYPDRVKLIHRHFPMDSRFNPILKTPFHEGAGLMSLIAIHAAENGKFLAG